jgi:hypothetical protein
MAWLRCQRSAFWRTDRTKRIKKEIRCTPELAANCSQFRLERLMKKDNFFCLFTEFSKTIPNLFKIMLNGWLRIIPLSPPHRTAASSSCH